jgi:hypothetical protein
MGKIIYWTPERLAQFRQRQHRQDRVPRIAGVANSLDPIGDEIDQMIREINRGMAAYGNAAECPKRKPGTESPCDSLREGSAAKPPDDPEAA